MGATLLYRTAGSNCPVNGSHYVTIPHSGGGSAAHVFANKDGEVVWSEDAPSADDVLGAPQAPAPIPAVPKAKTNNGKKAKKQENLEGSESA